jgi:hypothetical protein
MVGDDAWLLLLRVLGHALQGGSAQTMGDRVARRTVSLDPNNIERFLPEPMTIEDVAARVHDIAARVTLTDDQQE